MNTLTSLWLVKLAGLQAISCWAAPTPIDRLEASVNSGLILLSDVDHFRKVVKLRSQLDPLFSGTTVASKGEQSADSEIVDFLIDEKLISQVFPVTDAEVEQEVNSIQSNNRIDRAALKHALSEQGFSFEDYFELIRTSASKRNLIDRDIRTKVSITDTDVKNYFYNHYTRNNASRLEFHLKMIFISAKSYKTAAAARDAAQSALKSLKEGESFEEVAKRASDDPSSQAGGDLGVLSEDQISPLIRDQVKKLQIGQISDIFGSPGNGFYIVKLMDVKSDDTSRLERLKEEIRNQMIASEYQHQISLWLERQRQTAFIHRAGEAAIVGIPTKTP